MLAAIRAAQAEARAEARAEALEQAARTVYRGVEGCHASASELDALVAAILALKASP